MTTWIVHYKCGCTDEAPLKRDLLEYCGIHGHDRQELYKLGAAPKVESMPHEHWLLAKKIVEGHSHYLGIEGGMFRWVPDKDKALHLARRQDADKLAEIIDDTESIVGWIAP
jgi:hypothetical protein